MATATVDVIAPRCIILPMSENGEASTHTSGQLFISGNELYWCDGTLDQKITDAAV